MIHQRTAYSIPAAGSITNLVAGTAIEYITRASTLKIFATADSSGDTFGVTIVMGGDARVLVPSGSTINLASATGAGPKLDEDLYGEWGLPQGAHIIVTITGTSGHTGRMAFEVNP
jgi:hypothetical protein